MSAARVLTVRQPWASLTALGHKRIEVRTRPTKYRGTVLIQAGAEWAKGWRGHWFDLLRDNLTDAERAQMDVYEKLGIHENLCEDSNGDGWYKADRYALSRVPSGAVVAVAELADCLPVVEYAPTDHPASGVCHVCVAGVVSSYALLHREGAVDDIGDQLPYCGGLLIPGNYAYLWADVRPLREPIPHKGGLGLQHASDELYAAAMEQVS